MVVDNIVGSSSDGRRQPEAVATAANGYVCAYSHTHTRFPSKTRPKREKVQDQYHAVTAWTQAPGARAPERCAQREQQKAFYYTTTLLQPLNATLHSQVATKLTDGKPNGTTTNNLSAPVLLNSPIDDDDGIKAHFVPLCVPYYFSAGCGAWRTVSGGA